MAEVYRTDAVNSLGAVFPPTGLLYPAKGATGDAAHAEVMAQALLHLADLVEAASTLQVYKDGANPALTVGVRAGAFYHGSTLVTYAGATGFALDDDATVSVWLTVAGVLTKGTAGFPNSDHIPLAVVLTGSASAATTPGSFAVLDISDHRGRAIFSPASPSPARSPFRLVQDFHQGASTPMPQPWSKNVHLSGTGDFMADEPAGVYQLALENTSEIQGAQLNWSNQRMIDTDNNPIAEFLIRVDGIADLTSVEAIYIGLVADHTNAEDSMDNIDHSVWFKLKGAADLNVYMAADDGSTDTPDTDTLIDLVDDTWTAFRIDMSDLTAVVMSVDGVAAGATLDMTDSAGQVLQPIICLQRTADTEAEVGFQVEIDIIDIDVDR